MIRIIAMKPHYSRILLYRIIRMIQIVRVPGLSELPNSLLPELEVWNSITRPFFTGESPANLRRYEALFFRNSNRFTGADRESIRTASNI